MAVTDIGRAARAARGIHRAAITNIGTAAITTIGRAARAARGIHRAAGDIGRAAGGIGRAAGLGIHFTSNMGWSFCFDFVCDGNQKENKYQNEKILSSSFLRV